MLAAVTQRKAPAGRIANLSSPALKRLGASKLLPYESRALHLGGILNGEFSFADLEAADSNQEQPVAVPSPFSASAASLPA